MTETLVLLLDVLARLGDIILKALEDTPDSNELKAEALARLAIIQKKLQDHDEFAAGLQAELDTAVPPD
jgi:hypothetical protein